MLPREVVQHIFSVAQPGWSYPELELEDRLRAMAVCSAWRDCLDPRKWPIDKLELDGWDDEKEHLLLWVLSTRPAAMALDFIHYKTPQLLSVLLVVPRTVLEALCIEADSQTISDCLPAICLFPALRRLDLMRKEVVCEPVTNLPLDVRALAPLTTLEELAMSGWYNISWEGGPLLLPGITQLQLGNADSVTLNTALPSLRKLRVYDASTVILGGEHFHAPGLSSLSLNDIDKELGVNWCRLGSLERLHARVTGSAVVWGAAQLSALTCLTALSLGWSQGGQGAWDSALALLQAAPRSLLRSLSLDAWSADRVPPLRLAGLMQLTSLQCGTLDVLSQLSQLKQLQELHFSGDSPASLCVDQLALLSELASLRRLRFIRQPTEVGVWTRYLKVLQAVLPRGCEVAQAYEPWWGAWRTPW